MSNDHLAHVADAACAPSGRLSDMSWSGIMPRTADQTDKQTDTPSAHIFGKCTPAPCWALGGIPIGVETYLAPNTEGGVKVSVCCGYTQLLTQEKSPVTLTQTISWRSWFISHSLNGAHCLNHSLSSALCWSGSCNKPTWCLFVCLLSSLASFVKASC